MAASWGEDDADTDADEEGEQPMSKRVLAALPRPVLEAPPGNGGRPGVVSLGVLRRWPDDDDDDDDNDDDDDDEEDAR